MATGDLSSDQARYVDLVVKATGLARDVVVAWVGSESGWGVNKAGHNYLNIGPGRTYASTEQAAAAAAALVNASDYYVGIRAAIPAGGGAQVAAIADSPWGTDGGLLSKVYGQLAGSGGAPVQLVATQTDPYLQPPTGTPDPGTPTVVIPGWDPSKNIQRGIPEPLTGLAKDIFEGLTPALLKAGLGVIFTVAAFVFIAMGINRLTGGSLKSIFDTVSGAVGAAGGAAKLAAI